MNLLVIGNGLDLDLGLPTKYTDFLKFTSAFEFSVGSNIDEVNKIDEFDTQNVYYAIYSRYEKFNSINLENQYQELKATLKLFEKSFENKFINKACKDFLYCVHNNCWIKYFNERYEKKLISGENWIDIENEIQNIIHIFEDKSRFQIIDEKNNAIIDTNFNYTDNLDIQEIINKLFSGELTLFVDDYKKFKRLLLKDYDKFVMALGIYLNFFVSQLPIKIETASRELQNMINGENFPTIDYVLSFNYINNFKHTGSLKNTCLVHGEINYMAELKKCISANMNDNDKVNIKIENLISRNKIIIGFDDLQSDEENFELEFVDYRKYFQRIYKGTDSQYVDWLNEYTFGLKRAFEFQKAKEDFLKPNSNLDYEKFIEEKTIFSDRVPNRVFIFGHSLDATDNEIFRDIFLREFNDTKVTIFYHDSDARKRIITNLIRILTKPIFIQKTKGKNPDIKFIEQTYNSSVF